MERFLRAPKRIAVVGGGPSGVTAAKYLLAEGFLTVDIFEQRPETGGVWNYTPETKQLLPKLPLVDPNFPEEPFLPCDTTDPEIGNMKRKTPIFLSPVY